MFSLFAQVMKFYFSHGLHYLHPLLCMGSKFLLLDSFLSLLCCVNIEIGICFCYFHSSILTDKIEKSDWFLSTPGSVQGLFLAVHSGITPDDSSWGM